MTYVFIKGLSMDEIPVQCAFAGDSVSVTLAGADMNNVAVGQWIFIFYWFTKFLGFGAFIAKILP